MRAVRTDPQLALFADVVVRQPYCGHPGGQQYCPADCGGMAGACLPCLKITTPDGCVFLGDGPLEMHCLVCGLRAPWDRVPGLEHFHVWNGRDNALLFPMKGAA